MLFTAVINVMDSEGTKVEVQHWEGDDPEEIRRMVKGRIRSDNDEMRGDEYQILAHLIAVQEVHVSDGEGIEHTDQFANLYQEKQ